MATRWKKGDYTTVPNRNFIRGKDSSYRSVYLALCDRADEYGVCYPSYEKIAEDAGCSARTAKDRIKKMCDDKVITKTSKGRTGKSNTYQINDLVVDDTTEKGCAGDALGCAGDAQQGVQEVHTNYNQLTKTKELVKSLSKKKPEKKKYGQFKNVLLSDVEKEKLKTKLGPVKAKKLMNELDFGIEMKGYKYKSHYAVILKWSQSKNKNNFASRHADLAREAEKQRRYREDQEYLKQVEQNNQQLKKLSEQKNKLADQMKA